MRKVLKKLILIAFVINFIGITIEGGAVGNGMTIMVNDSNEKDRLQAIKEKGIITVASPQSEPPFFVIDSETKEISGIDADIINEIPKMKN